MQTGSVARTGSAASTPIPRRELLRLVEELRALLDELRTLADAGHLWGLRALSADLDRALAGPVALGHAQNQLDLVETLTDAAWEAREGGMGRVRADAGSGGQEQERRLEAVRSRLEEIADQLAQRVDTWQRRRTALE
jgi:hypothetical protein